MSRHLRPALLSILLLVHPLLAQQTPNGGLGFQPNKSFQMGEYDTVNLFNGNLTVALPIGSTYTPGGALAYGLHLIYNGNAWAIQSGNPNEAIPNRFSNAGLGWKMTLGELVAPNDPAIRDISTGGAWVYIAPDGSEHIFYQTLHLEEAGSAFAGSDLVLPNTVVGYTRDGSYMRLVRTSRIITLTHPCAMQPGFCNDYTLTYSIEAADGNVHRFEAQITKAIDAGALTVDEDNKLPYRLVSIADRFGNYVHVTYPDLQTWRITDGTPAGDIRTQTVHLRNDTFYEYTGQPTAHLFVDRVDLAAFGGQTATYQFNYSDNDTISKDCDDQYPGVTTKTRFLNSITQPDGSTFSMDYNRLEYDTGNVIRCSQAAGHLLKLTFPTGGGVRYTIGQRVFPASPESIGHSQLTWRDHSVGIETRTLLNADNTTAGTWTYRAQLTNAFNYTVDNVTIREYKGLVVSVQDALQRTSAYYYTVDRFADDPGCYPDSPGETEYGMAFTRMAGTAASSSLLLSSEVYDVPCTIQLPAIGAGCTRSCLDASNQPVQPSRSNYVQYEQDSDIAGLHDQERRVRKRRTVFNADTGCAGAPCYQETDVDEFDGLGHYRSETSHSNFPGTSPRVTITHYNARGGTYVPGGGSSPSTYMIPTVSSWLPGVYDYQTTAGNGQTARSELCFNSTTAFLERRRTWRNTDRSKDLLAIFDQTGGNLTAESYFGGDSTPLPSGFATCTSDPGAPAYRLTHHYTAGSLDSTQYAGLTFKALDLTIDQSTGLPSASKDTTGLLTTTYLYDKMQRVTEVRPPSDAWTKYTYTLGAHSSLEIIRRPFGSGSDALARTSTNVYFDSFGRPVLNKERFPEGWSATTTAYDLLGRAISTSMPEFRTTASWEDFTPTHVASTTYDRFDRPLSITMSDGKSTTFTYTGSRVTSRTACVASGPAQVPCQSGERPFTTVETVDGHGRLATVTEPLDVPVTTTYGYDVGNRLISVSTAAPEGLQQRSFAYDLAGLLTSETHPEKGTSGYGTVSYPEYDARGHLRHRIDGAAGGAFDTTFTFDDAERLVNVKDIDPVTHAPRDLKNFSYGTTSGNALGRLQTATRHNYQPSLGGDIAVAETYVYGGPNGRVSARGTAVSGAFPANSFTLGQTWDDLGNVASISYPSNGSYASTPARTVGYSHTNGLLTGIDGYAASMTHLANGIVGHLAHSNGESEDWTADPAGMTRPDSIHITGNGVDRLIGPYLYDASGNIKQVGGSAGTYTSYQYDGVGRLTGSTAFTPPSLYTPQTFNYDSFGNKLGENVVSMHRFDPNGDGFINSLDIFYLVNYLFLGGPTPQGSGGLLSGDANNDGHVNSLDIFFLVNYLFLGGPAPSIPTASLPSGDTAKPNKDVVDSITVGTVTATGTTVDVPVYIRDIAGTPLGRDRVTGSRIQSFSITVGYSPSSAVSSVAFSRSGITAGLAPSAEFYPSTSSSVSLVDTFQESTQPVPFTANAAPGQQVAHLIVTLSGSAPPGTAITLSLDPSLTLLADEGGNTSESPAGGTLALVDGAILIPASLQTTPASVVTPGTASAGARVLKSEGAPKPAIFLRNVNTAAATILRSPKVASYTTTTNHDASFVYDAAGNVVLDDASRLFTYDALSMTTGATVLSGGTRSFAYLYTADDERIALVEKLSAGTTRTTWTLRGLDNHLLRTWVDTASAGSHVWSWSEDEIWRGASLLAYESATGVRHYGLDHLGSPVVLTDSTGNSVGNVTYDPFGNGGATGAGMLAYTGQERDAFNVGASTDSATLPDYMHARFYNSTAGRFLSIDPEMESAYADMPQSWNRYAYALNNPMRYTDPTGLKPCKIRLSGGDATAAGVSDGTEVDGECVEATDPRTTPIRLGWEWLTGTGPRDRHFTDGDDMTEMLKRHEHVRDVAREVCGGSRPSEGNANYDLSGVGGVPKYLSDYSTLATGGATGNLAVTYLGSYKLQYSLAGANEVHMTAMNSSTAASGLRPPVLGYTAGWNKYVGGPMNQFFSLGPMSETRQTFDFDVPCQ